MRILTNFFYQILILFKKNIITKKKLIYHRSFFLFLFQHLLADQNIFSCPRILFSVKMFPQLQKLFFALAFFAFISSQIAEGKKFECYTNNHNQTKICAIGQNLCVRASRCHREIKHDPTFFHGDCVWNEMDAIEFCIDFLAGNKCDSCKVCNTSKCDDERFMKELARSVESNETKDHGRSTIVMNNTSTMPSTSSEFSSTINPSTSTPSGAISTFNGLKWESFIAMAILTASALLLTAVIF